MSITSRLYFDAKDYELLSVVNKFLDRDTQIPGETSQKMFHAYLHPHGIKELAVSQEIRVAYAVINLLDSLEVGLVHERLNALRALHDEVLYSASSSFRHNTGRVLIQIMKGLIRAHGNFKEQLRLAHDFRNAASGSRRIIRKMLHRYYLLEMPEEWNQIAFDHHVHDANTKGRKSPTHLIMDAWIKGIRQLDVLYYNYVEPTAVEELLQAAEIMGIEVNICVEFQARFHGRYVQFIWEPKGFLNYHEVIEFLNEKPTQHLMRMGREASQYHHNYVLQLLERYNEVLRFDIGEVYNLELQEIRQEEILALVGIGQTSRTHLAELILRRIREAFRNKYNQSLQHQATDLTLTQTSDHAELVKQMSEIDALDPNYIIEHWLSHAKNPDIAEPRYSSDSQNVPELMRLLPSTLIDWLTSIRPHSHITLNLRNLTLEDVLELLYDCKGMITHLELFNLKNYLAGYMIDLKSISELQRGLNEDNAVALKRLIRSCIKEHENNTQESLQYRQELFVEILQHIPKFQSYYANSPLGTKIGSDSTSRTSRVFGMGFVFQETLPARALKEIKAKDSQRKTIPIHFDVFARVTFLPRRHQPMGIGFTRLLRKLPWMRFFGMRRQTDWAVDEKTVSFTEQGNITTLGGSRITPVFNAEPNANNQAHDNSVTYMNTTAKNIFKVAFGFLITSLTFWFTQSWWFLAWFGPIIWFAITGLRNIIQATLGGGGLKGSPLLRWNDYLSWSRLSDSLLYTGLSVPLLELGVRWFFLEKVLHLNSLDSPLLFFSILSIINGFYIASHNLFRGLPQEAVIGNIFRSFLAIPLSMFYSFLALQLFIIADWQTPAHLVFLQQSSAVLSKLASDTVAAVIEGFADKAEYLRKRHWDYKAKLHQLFSTYAKLDTLLPEEDVLDLLRRPKVFLGKINNELQDMEISLIVNALDLMYFWMYQPRARSTIKALYSNMSRDEQAIFAYSQLILTRVHDVSQLFVDGLVGPNFAKPLAFYLDKSNAYLHDMEILTGFTLTEHQEVI